MLHLIKKIIPASLLDVYHLVLSWIAAVLYRHPSKKLIVVGVTGTNGKTTTSYLVSKALESVSDKTGCATTALFKIGEKEWLNDTKMTMLGRFELQRLLRDMLKAGCTYAVIETSSQGILQHRHRNIEYDVAVFTNLTPEHIEAHGGFENYKNAKKELFKHVAERPDKFINGKRVPKIAVLNRLSEHAGDFVVSGFDQTVWYGIGRGPGLNAVDLQEHGWATSFTVEGVRGVVNMPSRANVENAMAAIATAVSLGLPLNEIIKKIGSVKGVPGRFEKIEAGQPFTVIVDYAPEPASLNVLYEAVDKLPHARIIHVLGSAGGGRDISRRPILGHIAGEKADLVIITNEDPYDDDPREIMEQVAKGARDAGKTNDSLKIIPDRREAIFEAIKIAEPGDLVLLTGKGCEQAIMIADGGRIPLDERNVAREALKARL
ncbi:MAG: UDP-N-acetylmuramoyl-L-alanyl-D-glutamate--2,6-diaminopimelate ligase [Patescibacteria group bacterium]